MNNTAPAPHLPKPIILWANHFQFKAGQVISFPCVQSRMLVYCLSGKGSIRTNGRTFEASAGTLLFLPWEHSICYTADLRSPMLLCGIHVIPWFDSKRNPVVYQVSHRRGDPWHDDTHRRDAPLEGLEGISSGKIVETSSLSLLVRYIIEWFRREPREEQQARDLAFLLLKEVRSAVSNSAAPEVYRSLELERVLSFVNEQITTRITIDDIAGAAQCSPSTLSRLFRKHFAISPVQWLLRTRMERAGVLLATSSTRIGQIGRAVGLVDPYYFSKLFKKFHGMTAGEFRRRNSML